MKITLCLIVRNEEKNIAQCLEAFKPLYDEIIVADTGSTDSTKAIAASFGAHIFDFVWCDDFSAARNFALDQVQTEWVIMVDADDIMEKDAAKKLRKELLDFNSDIQGVILPYLMPPYDRGLHVSKARIWRSSLKARYKLAVHEYLDIPKDQLRHFVRLEYAIQHSTPTNEYQKSMKRNLAILKKAVQREPSEPRYYFYLGHDSEQDGKIVEAIEWYAQLEELVGVHPDELNRALIRKGKLQLQLGNVEAAERDFLKALEIQPAFIDPYLELARIKTAQKSYGEAEKYYEKATQCTVPTTHVFINRSLYEGYAQKQLLNLKQQSS